MDRRLARPADAQCLGDAGGGGGDGGAGPSPSLGRAGGWRAAAGGSKNSHAEIFKKMAIFTLILIYLHVKQ